MYDVTGNEKVSVAPEIVVSVHESEAGIDAAVLVGPLRRENPRVFIGADSLGDSSLPGFDDGQVPDVRKR